MLAGEGAHVTVMDVNAEGAEAITQSICEGGGSARTSVVDLTEWNATEAAIREAYAGVGQLDIVVHSAGAFSAAGFPKYVGLLDCPVEAWDPVLNINLKSMFHLLKVAAPLMIKGEYGRFVSISSMAARSGTNPNPPHYSAAKGGMLALSRQAALELGPHGITVNAVAPANVNSPRGLAGRTSERIEHIKKNHASPASFRTK